MSFLPYLLLPLAALLVAIAMLRLLHPLPPLAGRSASKALDDTDDTPLGQRLSEPASTHQGLSGVHIVSDGFDAFAARSALARAATRCIDAQYYIWRGDLTGKLLLRDLLNAADRGVRVRLLLDDNPTAGLDALWSAANRHPHIEVRLFNPFTIRAPRSFNYLTDFKRLNRRMHNKSFTADNQASIVGGRNIGNEYFSATDQMQFADMDMLATGAVVRDISSAFDSYWTSASSYPAELVMKAANDDALQRLRHELDELAASEKGTAYERAVHEARLVPDLLAGKLVLEWLKAELVYDDPAKGLGSIPRARLLIAGLTRALGAAQMSFDMATAYFVPGRLGARYIRRIAQGGRQVRVLTNSLASTDVAAVHAGYARYRRRLMRAGVRMFEMKPRLSLHGGSTRNSERKFPRLGSSRSSLHAKLFLVDREHLFIGSFNFDPRSVYLNCEMGIMISSRQIGEQVGQQFDQLATRASFEPRFGRFGKLKWLDGSSGATVAVETEPESSLGQRLLVRVIGWLPVEWLL